MVTISLSITIPASTRRVWHALTEPEAVVAWDTGVVEPIDAPEDYPQSGQHVRWRYRLGPIPLILHDRPLEVIPEEKLRSEIKLAFFYFDETYTLHQSSEHPGTTELSVKLDVWNRIPVVGNLLDRLVGKPIAAQTVASSLGSIKSWCTEL